LPISPNSWAIGPAAVARELTKMFEEVRRAPLASLPRTTRANRGEGRDRLVIGRRAKRRAAGRSARCCVAAGDGDGLGQGCRSRNRSALWTSRRDVYARALELKRKGAS
jgi:16S rRNA (cytidine1402-2'-O)-methyltransferase